MNLYNIILGLAGIVAFLYIWLVFFTSKGDMSSGGGQVRTSFTGRATFDDQIAKYTLGLSGIFLILMLILDYLNANPTK